ncbi:MAG: hypothetical protein U0441_14900 [Polyangiaceae bacterium]
MNLQYPQTTGFAYTLASAQIDVGGRRIVGIRKVDWSESMDGSEKIYGASKLPIAETEGLYAAECGFEILHSEFDALIAALGPGYMQVRFNLGAQLMDTGRGLSSLFIPSCRIINSSGTLDDKATYTAVKCSVLGQITRNGISAIASGALTLGSTIGGSATVVSQVGATLGFSL